MVGSAQNFDVVVVGSRFSRHVYAQGIARQAGAKDAGLRSWRNRWRHLVLEPLPGQTTQYGATRLAGGGPVCLALVAELPNDFCQCEAGHTRWARKPVAF
jgi:hypothetical protein